MCVVTLKLSLPSFYKLGSKYFEKKKFQIKISLLPIYFFHAMHVVRGELYMSQYISEIQYVSKVCIC